MSSIPHVERVSQNIYWVYVIFPCAGEGMRRLVDMIKFQHQAWNERMAARARQPLHSPPLPQSTHAVPHSERGTSSLDLSGQPESLSVYTLSSR